MAMTRIDGSQRRTTMRNSKPGIGTKLRSDRRISGISFRISVRPEEPSAPDRTRYPRSEKILDRQVRAESSLSTMRSFTGFWSTGHLIDAR
jgi:hypothetical protein